MTDAIKIVTTNRKARHDYHIDSTLEVGIALVGTEVKSLRAGRANLQDAYCTVDRGELMLHQCHISPYTHASHFNHQPTRVRKLLAHRKEIAKLDKASRIKGHTLIPMKIYFKNGRAKVEVAVARGKKQYDKRASIAEREMKRRLERSRGTSTE